MNKKHLFNFLKITNVVEFMSNAWAGRRNRLNLRQGPRPVHIEQLERRDLLAAHPLGITDPGALPEGEGTAVMMPIGTNLEPVYDWSPAWLFTDIFKHSRDWIPHEQNTVTGEFVWQGTSAVNIDEHGWPTELEQWTNQDNQLVVQSLGTLMYRETGGNYPGGVYRAEWDGVGSIASGAIEFDWDAAVIAHGTTPAGRNFADLLVTPSNEGIYLGIHQIADPSQPITNINVWMPDYQGESFVGHRDWTPGASFSPFHPLLVEQLAEFNTLRFMAPAGTLDTHVVDWSERRALTDARQVVWDRIAEGMAPEYMVELTNQVGSNAWLNMPHTAGDDYVENLAIMMRDNLDPSHTIYVEWSNEAWNPEYAPYHWVTGQMDPVAGLDRWDIMAREIRRDFDIWSDVFAGQEHRLVRVVGAFTHTPEVAEQLLLRMNGAFDALASAAYVSPDAEERASFAVGVTTPAEVLQFTRDSSATTLGYLNEHRTLLEEYEQILGRDLGFILYEGGPHLDVDDAPNPETFAQAFTDPAIYEIQELLLNGTHDLDVDLFMDFQFTERFNDGVGFNATLGGNFGSLQAQDQPLAEAHKFRALQHAFDGTLIDLVNQRPTISEISDQVIQEGDVLQLPFTIGDAETPADSLTLIADASESELVPNASISITGTGTNRTLSITPQASTASRALLTILVVDAEGGTALESFYLDVIPPETPQPNTPPTANATSLITVEDNDLWINLWEIGDDAETPFEQLVFSFDNVVGGTISRFDTWSAIFTPATNFNGPAGFDFTVTDDGDPALSANATVSIDVTPVNDYPTAGHLSIQTTEDTSVEFSLASIIGDVETPVAQLVVDFPQIWGGTLATTSQPHGYRFTPEADEVGTVELWFQVVDGGGLDEWGSVTIEILPENDPPQAQSASLVGATGAPLWIDLPTLASDTETPFTQLIITFNNLVGGTIQQVDPYTAIFTPDPDFLGIASFNYTVRDVDPSPRQTTSLVEIAIGTLEELNGNHLAPELEATLQSIAATVAS